MSCTLLVRCGCEGGGKGALVSEEASLTLATSNAQTLFDDRGGNMEVRRLTPTECERLQGFPDFWTELPKGSDTARYKALGNSVAVPCVDYLMRGIVRAIREGW